MSVILEALRKSEQQKKQDELPKEHLLSVQTNKARSSNRPLIVAYTLVVLLSGLLLTNWLSQRDFIPVKNLSDLPFFRIFTSPLPAPTVAVADKATPKTSEGPIKNTENSSRIQKDQPVNTLPSVPVITPPPIKSPPETAPPKQLPTASVASKKPAKPVAISELPPSVQRQIPTLNYASHWFDKTAHKSTVLINNLSLKEGASMGNGIIIKSITATGTVFDFNGWLFYLPMLENWPNTP
ncbi:MAG TPA: general secretion pathway protein GspB [Pseudomonadales bacterium]|nr:general secretion pathway protein GspB [Pseudomonadales bacterium]